MSEDVQAMMSGFFGSGATPTASPFTEAWASAANEGIPFVEPPELPPTDYTKYLLLAKGIGDVGRSIGAGRTAQAEGKIAGKIARIEAEKEKAKGRRLASTARAIAGAQGSAEGLPIMAELNILQAAKTDADAELFKGNVNKYYAHQKAKAGYMGAAGDLLETVLKYQEFDSGKTKSRAGKSLLTGKYDMIDRNYQAPQMDADDVPIGRDLWWEEVREFILVALYDRFSREMDIVNVAREICPQRWCELQEIEEQLRQYLQPGVEVPMRELLSRLRLWRGVALAIEFQLTSFAGSEKK